MARIRALKPEFWSSPSLPRDPWARLLFMAMWNWADDNGVGTANPRELLGFAFPSDEDLTLVDLRRMLEEIHRVLGVVFYTVEDRPYYSIPTWEKHQKFDRRSKGKFPGPDEAETWLYQQEHNDSTETHESTPSTRRDSVAGTGEQRNRGTEEQRKKSSSSQVADAPQRQDVISILDHFDEAMRSIDAKPPARNQGNTDAIRLLIDRDKYSPEQIKWIITWASRDPFWQSVILSPKKLRAKFEQLKLKATATKAATTNRVEAAFDVARELRAMEEQQHFLEIEG